MCFICLFGFFFWGGGVFTGHIPCPHPRTHGLFESRRERATFHYFEDTHWTADNISKMSDSSPYGKAIACSRHTANVTQLLSPRHKSPAVQVHHLNTTLTIKRAKLIIGIQRLWGFFLGGGFSFYVRPVL